jgi:DNA-binding phage protein
MESVNTGLIGEQVKVIIMSIIRDFKETINARVQREPEFAKALLDEAASLFLNGEPETARLILRDLVNATTGFEKLANETSLPSKSLHRMLSAKGNPTMNNLTAIFTVLRKQLNVNLEVHTVSSS